MKIPGMIKEAKKARYLPHGLMSILILLCLFVMSQLITVVFTLFFVIIQFITKGGDFSELITKVEDSDLLLLYGTVFTIILIVTYVIFVEKRSLNSIGLGKKHALKDYIIGYLIGVIMFGSIVLFLCLTGNMEYNGMTWKYLPIVIVFFIGFIIQGASEEVALRGYLMNTIAAKHNLIIAIIVNSSIFGILHLLNPNVSIIAIANIILFGVFASIYALKFNNIWGVCGIHSAWNFVQGNVFGLEVSGMKIGETIWEFSPKGNTLLTGGEFGPEGGLVSTIILTLSTIIIILYKLERNEFKQEK